MRKPLSTGLAVLLLLIATLSASVRAASQETIVFGDASWESIQFHNRVAGFIVEHGYGRPVDYLFGDTLPILHGLIRGDVDAYMEVWIDNIREAVEEALASGSIVNLGSNFPDAPQGWYVPTYVIKGDPERGIEPVAPDLRSVADLARYWEIFRDPEVPDKGRFYNCTLGWACNEINKAKLAAYGLDEYYVAFSPGSQAALNATIAAAYRRGQPWFGYYWEPTWVIGQYEMTRLEEPPYTDACWASDRGCAYPTSQVLIMVNARLREKAPEVFAFLSRYETELEHTNRALAHLNQTGGSAEEAAVWFLREYPDVWRSWVDADAARRVEEALEATGS